MTATRSGTPRRSCCRCSCSRTRGRGAVADALALATQHARPGARARAIAGASRRRVPVADDPRRGVLGLLAGGHRRVPHQRGHRRRRRALPAAHRGRDVRARSGRGVARRDRAAVALARPPRRRGSVPHRRGHRAGRVQRDRRQQRLHEPDGGAEPPSRGRRGRAPPGAGTAARRRRRGGRELARAPPRRCSSHTTSRSASIRRPRGSPSTRSGTSTRPRPRITRCCCTTRTSTCIASRSSSRPTW